MALNQYAKYFWLIRTIYEAKRITLKEIQQRYFDRFQDTLPRRTFCDWKDAVEDMLDININCATKGGYVYYLDNDMDEFHRWLLDAMSVNETLLDNKSLSDRILLEDIPSSQTFLATILQAMREGKVLEVTHKGFSSDDEKTFNLKPYCVKLFKQRWYVVGKNDYGKGDDNIRIYSLDRIISINLTNKKYTYPKDFDPEVYFRGSFGVILGYDCKIENVRLKVDANQANYLRSLPLHPSQEEVERHDDYSIFTLRLRPTFDFQQELLRNADALEVLEPQWLRDDMADKVHRMWARYNK
ncbi:MAG: WYL domain-containing protein [Salinivirgaceae bacterium]|nr:WYL domain-containing protein [Salinivirgaceae bacterium]